MNIKRDTSGWFVANMRMPDDAFLLHAYTVGGKYDGFVDKNGVGYQVPVGKKMKIVACIATSSSSGGTGLSMIKADAHCNYTDTPPSGHDDYSVPYMVAVNGYQQSEKVLNLEVGAGKYICMYAGTSSQAASATLICILEDE